MAKTLLSSDGEKEVSALSGMEEMMLNGASCEGCGKFIDLDAAIQAKKCEDRFESESIDAVENNNWPDGITFSVWQNIKRKYSEPELAFRE